ncbi:gastrula zinc finger protein XlCGF9.1-like isoform X2 [Megalobrama amblycephala]|uniref:gastrula zinc finger protein XlCGF9.1-like isoform X2 n=1 Tax=Megalobrama amblycephala TaxID=75352 RepID=UPI002013D2D1|nr:gastrula zinc finger protein XlCGF9.1-like isoform X2 [Megalobrama amblycephala]
MIIKMMFIKEESEDMKIEETFRVKHEETEEQTDLTSLKEENEVLKEEKDQYNNHHDFTTGERSCSCSQTESTSSRKMTQKKGTRSPLICQQCGNRYTQKETLFTHTEIYTEKLYTCPRCGKSFNRKGHLEDHMRVHTGEKPFICQQCGKNFTRRGSLKRHLRIHTEEKPYSCPQCGKRFIQRGHFKDHLRIHSGEKPERVSEIKKALSTT